MKTFKNINERLFELLPTTEYKITDHKEESFKWATNYQTDVTYLLSIIEQADKALHRSIIQMRTDAEEIANEAGFHADDSEVIIEAIEALKAIRGT